MKLINFHIDIITFLHIIIIKVKRMAAERFVGLSVLTKKESMGVCFIGKRSMPAFLSNYIELTPGR